MEVQLDIRTCRVSLKSREKPDGGEQTYYMKIKRNEESGEPGLVLAFESAIQADRWNSAFKRVKRENASASVEDPMV
jgi:hypothetical protein